tara:strand:- start:3413 stop:4240 length:828 start_codon:yes stop_codon:yes gene_type:complete
MVVNDIKENIRFYKANDPYFYEVDNLPLIDLLNNDKILRDEINLILDSTAAYITESSVDTKVQDAIGDATKVDIDNTDGSVDHTNIISWIEAQEYGGKTITGATDTAIDNPSDGDTLIYSDATGKWGLGANLINQQREITVSETVMFNSLGFGDLDIESNRKATSTIVENHIGAAAGSLSGLTHYIVRGGLNSGGGSGPKNLQYKGGERTSVTTFIITSGNNGNTAETYVENTAIVPARTDPTNNTDFIFNKPGNMRYLRILGYIVNHKIKAVLA